MTHTTELIPRNSHNLPSNQDYDTLRDSMADAPIFETNEATATAFMATYSYALWPVGESRPGHIMVEIKEPESTIDDEHGHRVYDMSPTVCKGESIRSFEELMRSPLGGALSGLGYKVGRYEDAASKRVLLRVELPSLKTLGEYAQNGVKYVSGHEADFSSLDNMYIDQTSDLAEGLVSVGGNDEAVAQNMIWSAPFIALAPPVLMTGLVEMSRALLNSDGDDNPHNQINKGRPAQILSHFSIFGSIISKLNNVLKNEQGIPGVDYSPLDELGWEINNAVKNDGEDLADKGLSLAKAMLTHVKQLQRAR